MGAGQRAGQRLPRPPDERHHEGGRDDEAVGILAAELVTQPHIDHSQQGDQGEFEAVGPGRPQDGQQQPVGRARLDIGSDHRRRGFDEGAPAHGLTGVVTMRMHQGST
jgi:hypothetical protein